MAANEVTEALESEEARAANGRLIEAAALMGDGIKGLSAQVSELGEAQVEEQQQFTQLISMIGEDGTDCCSVGRGQRSYQRIPPSSDLQLQLHTMIENKNFPPEMRQNIIQLRQNIINYCAESQKFCLYFMKDELLDEEGGSKEYLNKLISEVEDQQSAALKDHTKDFTCQEDLLGNLQQDKVHGKLMETAQQRKVARGWNCTYGASYDQFLLDGEIASERLLQAADFVAGRRRRSPRSKLFQISYVPSEHFYGDGICINSRGMQPIASSASAKAANQTMPRSILGKIFRSRAVPPTRVLSAEAGQEQAVAEAMGSKKKPAFLRFGKNAAKRSVEIEEGVQVEPEPPLRKTMSGNGFNGKIQKPENFTNLTQDQYSEAYNKTANRMMSRMMRGNTREASAELREEGLRENPIARAEAAAEDVIDPAEDSGSKPWGYYRQQFMSTLGNAIKIGWPYFFIVSTFVAIAHDKAGCYLEKVDKDGELQGHQTKICQSVTWPNGPFSWWPASGIKNNCNKCQQVWDSTLNGGKGWDPVQIPLNLIHNGCTDIGNAEKRKCRKSKHSPGYDYVWSKESWFTAMINTISSFATDAGGCIQCLGNMANLIFGGGLGMIFGIIIVLIIVWVIVWIYRNFFADPGGTGSASPMFHVTLGSKSSS